MKHSVNTILLAIFTLFPLASRGAVNPNIDWETISTPHFEIVYDARHYSTARRYALRMEFNYKLLSSYFTEQPEKTILVLNDSSDLANGYATNFPYMHIVAFPVLPAEHESISDYADWAQELTLHEYTHILNFEPAHGFMKGLRNVMGSVISPTMLLPRWWHEGLAVEMETRFSSHGRLRSNYQDATLRALAKEDLLSRYSIADINESSLDTWPRGARPYLFGSLLLAEIQSIKGGAINNNLLQQFSSRMPFFINGPAEDEMGENFATIFKQTISKIDTKARVQLKKINETPTSPFTPLSSKYMESHSPKISPDGRFLAFIAKNKWGKSSIQIFDRKNENRPFDLEKDAFSQFLSIDNQLGSPSSDAPPAGNINRVAWLPNSTGFIFDQVRYIDIYSNFSDLHFYDLSTAKTKRLTRGLRLREPSMAPQGHLIAAIQLEQSDSKVVTIDREGKNLQTIYTPASFHKVSNPIFLDDQTIAFTERNLSGETSLNKINLLDKVVTTISLPNIKDLASLDSEGTKIFFVARENGLQNLYMSADQFKTIERLTNTDTSTFDGCIDERQGIVYTTTMTGGGQSIASTPYIKSGFQTPPPKTEPLMEEEYGHSKVPVPNDKDLEAEFGSGINDKKSYQASKYLKPRYWLPFVFVSDSGYGTQISTSSFDPLEKHSYSVQAGYDTYVQESNLGLSYANTTLAWPFRLSLTSLDRNQPGTNYQFSAHQANFLTYHDLRPWSDTMTVGLGFDSRNITATSTRNRAGPQIVLAYDAAGRSAFSEVPFSGQQLLFYGNYYLKTQSLQPFARGILSGTYYHSRYLPERHIALIHAIVQQTQVNLTELRGESAELTPSDSFHMVQDFSAPRFVLRGYEQGYFYFRNAKGATFEYHLPLMGPQGKGTFPAFLRRTRMTLFAEAMAVDGYFSDYAAKKYQSTSMKTIFSSYGLELKGDFTLGYYFPLTGVLGIYQRPQYTGSGKQTLFVGFQI